MKIKKNQSGMTLVEVVISLGVFSFTFLGVTMCLAAALKLNNRNMLRDSELNVQQKVLEEHQAQGVALLDGHTIKNDTITFGSAAGNFSLDSGTGKVSGITEFHAIKTAANGNTYNFELKGIASDRSPLGSERVIYNPAQNTFCLNVINDTNGNIDVDIEVQGGSFYEGEYGTGYRSNSATYARTIGAKDSNVAWSDDVGDVLPKELLVGYYNDATLSNGDIVITIRRESGSPIVHTVDVSRLKTEGKLTLTINNSANPAVSWG